MVHRTRIAATSVVILALAGCALVPNTVAPVIEHVSHLTQHPPFASHDHEYGYNQVALVAHWRVYRAAFIELSEGYNWGTRNGEACAGLYGPREVFSARAGWLLQVRP